MVQNQALKQFKSRTGKIVLWAKCLLSKHGDLDLAPRHLYKSQMQHKASVTSALRGRVRHIPSQGFPVNQPVWQEMVRSRFSETLGLKNEAGE